MADRLSKENVDLVFEALTWLGEQQRVEGESSVLDLGSILHRVRAITPAAKSQYEIDQARQFADIAAARKAAGRGN